jgi:hypothetical protein
LSSGLSSNFKPPSTTCRIQRTRSIYHTFTDCQGILEVQKLLPSWYLCLLAYLPFPLFLPL